MDTKTENQKSEAEEQECFGTGIDYRVKHVTKLAGSASAFERFKLGHFSPPVQAMTTRVDQMGQVYDVEA